MLKQELTSCLPYQKKPAPYLKLQKQRWLRVTTYSRCSDVCFGYFVTVVRFKIFNIRWMFASSIRNINRIILTF